MAASEKRQVVIKYYQDVNTHKPHRFVDVLNVNRWRLYLEDHKATTNKQNKLTTCSGTCLKRTSFKADTSLRRTKQFVPDEFLRNPL